MTQKIKLFYLTCLFGVSSLWSQGIFESSWILPEEGRANNVFVNTRFMFGVSIDFQNLGEVSFRDSDLDDLKFDFDDGFIEIADINADNAIAYGFLERNAQLNADGNVESFTLSRFRTESLGTNFETDSDISPGWELGANYDIWKLTNRITAGFTVAVGFSPVKAAYNNTISANLIQESAEVLLPTPLIRDVVEPEDITSPNAPAFETIPDGPPVPLSNISFLPQEPVVQFIGGEFVVIQSDVRGLYEIEGALGTVRLGPYVDIQLTDRLWLYIGFGISAGYMSADFTASQSFDIPTSGRERLVTETVSNGEWLIGGYAEINLLYKINDKTSIYAGAQSHFLSDFDTQTNNDTFAEIDISKPTYLQMGFELDF